MDGMPRALISACLLGIACRYDGGSQRLDGLDRLTAKLDLIPVCPEQLGGLPTPRTPAERRGARVVNRGGEDVTAAFEKGAECACSLCGRFACRRALLKTRSPSCGVGAIYDGTFSGRLVPGDGVTAAALRAQGVALLGEDEIEKLI